MDDKADNPLTSDEAGSTQHKGRSLPLFKYEELFGSAPVVLIQLGNEVYELRRTRTGKLVLNK